MPFINAILQGYIYIYIELLNTEYSKERLLVYDLFHNSLLISKINIC